MQIGPSCSKSGMFPTKLGKAAFVTSPVFIMGRFFVAAVYEICFRRWATTPALIDCEYLWVFGSSDNCFPLGRYKCAKFSLRSILVWLSARIFFRFISTLIAIGSVDFLIPLGESLSICSFYASSFFNCSSGLTLFQLRYVLNPGLRSPILLSIVGV